MYSTTIFRTETLNYAHRLFEDGSDCGSIHGHNVVTHLRVTGPVGDNGMILPFAELKKTLIDTLGMLDHHLLLQYQDPMLASMLVPGGFVRVNNVFNDLEQEEILFLNITPSALTDPQLKNSRIGLFRHAPTTENILAAFFPPIVGKLLNLNPNIDAIEVELWETPKCGATLRWVKDEKETLSDYMSDMMAKAREAFKPA